MGSTLAAVEKGFKVNIVGTQAYERRYEEIKQPKPEEQVFSRSPGTQNYEKQDNLKFKSLLKDDREMDIKLNESGNPFISLNDGLKNQAETNFIEDNKNITQSGRNFLYDFFASAKFISGQFLDLAIANILKTIDDYYNTLSSKQVNDYVDLFLMMFNAYLEQDAILEDPSVGGETNFAKLHKGLNDFLKKSLKNKNEEMLFLFKDSFIEKIFEAINDKNNSDKVKYLVSLLYSILDPTDDQEVNLFKLFKEKVQSEETLYQCFAVLHDKIKVLTDTLIDGCLFYILNGIIHENPVVRYYSMQMLLKYGMVNVNFVYNFKKVLVKLAYKERDKENCLLIIEILCQILKSCYKTKLAQKDDKKGSLNGEKKENQTDAVAEKDPFQEDINFANSLIEIIVNRYQGDEIFILLFTKVIYDYLYDNYALYKILLNSLYNCNDAVFSFVFLDPDNNEVEDEVVMKKYFSTIFRGDGDISKLTKWNKVMLFKAYSLILAEDKEKTELSKKDYDFLKFLTNEEFEPSYSEIWKSSFNFFNLVIKDIKDESKAATCLSILEAFLICQPIQKNALDDWYDSLVNVFKEIIKEGKTTCKEIVTSQLDSWIRNSKIRQIVRDDIKKLAEVIPKDQLSHLSSKNIPILNESENKPAEIDPNKEVAGSQKNLSGIIQENEQPMPMENNEEEGEEEIPNNEEI